MREGRVVPCDQWGVPDVELLTRVHVNASSNPFGSL